MINAILILLITIALLAGLLMLMRRKRQKLSDKDEGRFNLEDIQAFVRAALQEAISASIYEGNVNDEEFNRRKARKNELRKALRNCMHGDIASKRYVKAYMKDILVSAYGFDEENVNEVIPFDRRDRLTPQHMFDILLHVYQKKYGLNALNELIRKHGLDQLRQFEDGARCYKITAEDIKKVYFEEMPALSLSDKLDIIVQRVYQAYKGLGAIDEIRDQNIDGVNGGTSGLPPDVSQSLDMGDYLGQRTKIPRAHDAIWIFYRGKSIHLSFLSFESDLELKRVCQNIYTFGSPGQLNETNGYMVNDMADGSRVVVVRPKMSESWAFFVRKFDISKAELEELLQDDNADLVIDMIKFLIKGARITGITGQQGTGKTTLLMAMVKHIDGTLNLRIQEMAFELRLRKIYPTRNILSFRETPTVSGQQGLDTQKKTDGAVNILGEVATHPIASWMIQMAQVASLFTLFTHHAKTFPSLIYSLRNSLLATGVFSNEKIAEKQVVDVIGFNIHLVKNEAGHRYIERITECVPLDDTASYPSAYKNMPDLESKLDAFMDTMTEYFARSTDRKSFDFQNVVEWRDGAYIAGPRLTERNIREMLRHMNSEDAKQFRAFLDRYWGEAS
ncbi:ATPase, T2SS/T4P/T4SS family [Paenibacillus turpanensis]|uniref:ATPase, T2SS/T4P/T4SS family n=1 Tax=Paenibacillus turpanensis TaxID=2689078 RepID=UPI001A9D72A9|nr:ATPase, T2SS/T4P/T4SS family [Paenibacillus turpanensis]